MQRAWRGHRAMPVTLATPADFCEQLADLGFEGMLEAHAKAALVHALHLGLFVRTPIKREM
jgi:hypothetical protein